jgi:hypothetical protein
MGATRKYFEILGRLNGHAPDDYEARRVYMSALMTIRRLERKVQRLAEADCNGEGYVGGKFYRLDGSTPGAYIGEDSVFTVASEKIEAKIKVLADSVGLKTEFQGDPRGYTVRLFWNDADISHSVFQ